MTLYTCVGITLEVVSKLGSDWVNENGGLGVLVAVWGCALWGHRFTVGVVQVRYGGDFLVSRAWVVSY